MPVEGMHVLKGHDVVPAESVDEWAHFMEHGDRHVAVHREEAFTVSTVFTGVSFHKPPMVFETMVFTKDENSLLKEFVWRYSSWQKAIEGHATIAQLARLMYGEKK